jgi:hypothetical protein
LFCADVANAGKNTDKTRVNYYKKSKFKI